MTNIQKIENDIKELPPQELAEFRAWFENFDADQWDSQFEQDTKSGELDAIAQKAITDFNDGKFKKI